MVLFLFVIMLLDLREAARRKLNLVSLAMGIMAVGALFLVYKSSLESTYGEAPQQHKVATDTGQAEAKAVGSTRALGQALFSKDNGFLLPFEIVSILLLVAMVGVILLSRKEPR
jgi:NADH-quinone oxidoreductase subunit J